MTDEELQEFDSAVRMTDMMAANDEVFKNTSKAMELKVALIADIGILETQGAARVSASGLQTDGTMDKRAARSALNKLVRKIALNAKTIKKAEPEFDNKFKIGRGSLSSQQLLDTARAYINDLTPTAVAKFSGFGMSATLETKLQEKIDAFDAARLQQGAGRSSGIAATAETKAAINRLKANRRIMKQVGENILDENGDAGLIAEWKSACRIEKSKPPAPATPPAPPTP